MKNHYDNAEFFEAYQEMPRSKYGLEAAGEWPELVKLLPDFKGNRVLDLGCGYGWHCQYAAEHGADYVLGIDGSQKMLVQAKAVNQSPKIEYRLLGIEKIGTINDLFDTVISSLALHYVADFEAVIHNVKHLLKPGGHFIFSVEHPIFTAQGQQEWCYDENGNILHWPVDSYYEEGYRDAQFLGQQIGKYHKTLTTYLNSLLTNGFKLVAIVEPAPSAQMIAENQEMSHELRRPMMLLIKAQRE